MSSIPNQDMEGLSMSDSCAPRKFAMRITENARFITQMSTLFEKLLQNTGKFKMMENYHV